MKLLFALIVAAILACGVLSANAHKPFEPRIDAKANEAAANMLVTPCPLTPQNLPTLSPERKV